MPPTLEQVRQQGLLALREQLGRAGMVRFLQQYEMGSGDYARERHAWVDRTSLADIRSQASRQTSRARKRR
jgi:hypothetical protein